MPLLLILAFEAPATNFTTVEDTQMDWEGDKESFLILSINLVLQSNSENLSQPSYPPNPCDLRDPPLYSIQKGRKTNR